MKRGVNILLGTCIIILLILMVILISDFTGKVIEETKKQVRFYFYDEDSGCLLNGYVFSGKKALGKSVDGFFNLSYENYLENVKDYEGKEEISIFGELGSCFNTPELFFDKSWIIPEIKKYHFPGENVFDFKTEINVNNPSNRELQGFIQPEKVSFELEKISTNGNKLNSLSEINKYLNNKIKYVQDWNFEEKINYWQTPVETLNLKQGDCEDYSTALLSLFLAYDSSLNCYNIVFESHVATFCHIEDYYVYYDQGRTELKKRVANINPTNSKSQLEKLNQEYFEYIKVNGDEEKPYYAFNDNEFVEFKDDFVDWQYNLENIKQEFDLFENIKEQVIENTKDLSDSWEQGELGTQTISLPSSKTYGFLIIGLFILIIVLVIILIRFNRT